MGRLKFLGYAILSQNWGVPDVISGDESCILVGDLFKTIKQAESNFDYQDGSDEVVKIFVQKIKKVRRVSRDGERDVRQYE